MGHPQVTLIAETFQPTATARDSATWQHGSFYLQSDGTPQFYDRWSAFQFSAGPCTRQGFSGSSSFVYQLPTSSPVRTRDARYVQVTEWYSSRIYPIRRVERSRLSFSNVYDPYGERFDTTFWDFPNHDLYQSQGHVNPRFRVLSNPARVRGRTLRYCRAETFLNVTYATLHSLRLTGLRLFCNKRHDLFPLLRLCNNTIGETSVRSCRFDAIQGTVIRLEASGHADIRDNTFTDCQHRCIEATNRSAHVTIEDNRFDRCGNGMFQNFCISCGGTGFLIRGNQITHFTYAAIGVGVALTNRHDAPITGLVERNTIDNSGYDTPDAIVQHTLMDGGAIYTWCWNDSVVIRHNVIRNFGGIHQYRGIFCDQGTKCVTVTGNHISNIRHNQWGVPQNYIEINWREDSHRLCPDHNTGNAFYDNTLDGGTETPLFKIEKAAISRH